MKLMEISNNNQVQSIDELVSFIKANCSEYLRQCGKAPLWRGMSVQSDTLVYHQRKDRKPTDMPYLVHNRLNSFFSMKFGFPYRNGIFTSGNLLTARDYSAPPGTRYNQRACIIIPVDGFTFCWSPNVNDLFGVFKRWRKHNSHESSSDDPVSEFIDYVDDQMYMTNDLSSAIASNCEVMLNCPNGFIAITDEVIAHLNQDDINYSSESAGNIVKGFWEKYLC